MPACIQNHLKLQWPSEEKQFKGNNTLSHCSDIWQWNITDCC